MGSQPEARLSRKIMVELRRQGYFVFKVWGNDHTMAGLPDIIVCAEGFFVGLETKMPEKRQNVSPIQQHRAAEITKAGGHVAVVCSVEEAVKFVRRAVKIMGAARDDQEA
jgi:hypothetical protein